MNRYLLYLVLLNMLTNIIIYVPSILIKYRFDGAVMGILIAIPLGIGLSFIFGKAISKFPEQGFPEILDRFFTRKMKGAILLITSINWFVSGLFTLAGFIDIVKRFINPELSQIYLAFIFLSFIFFVMQLPSQKIMYLLEIILFINVPIIFFIVFKAFTSEYFSWDSVFEVGTHFLQWPSIKSIAAASYCFSGFANVLVMNRLFKEPIQAKNFLVILFLGIFNLFTTFLIPIGFHGSDGAGEYLYPWITTADCLRIVYGPIERVIFIFLMFYTSISLISISIHWHVAFEFIKGITSKEFTLKKKGIIFAIFGSLSLITILKVDALHLINYSSFWLIGRVLIEILLVPFIFFLSWRQKK